MRTAIRKAGVACGALFASTTLAVSTANGAWASNSALVVAGLETSSLHDTVMSQLLGGALKGQQRVSVNWPAEHSPSNGGLSLGESISVGIENLDTQLDAALGRLAAPGEKVTVVGLSAGSLVVNEVLRGLVNDANAPSKDQVTFIVVADSSRQKVIDRAKYNSSYDYTYQPAPETKYDVSVVVAEFDGTHDFPDRWWHFTAVLNSIAGAIVGHIPVMFADLSKVPAVNIEVDVNNKGGKTTTYLVPSEELPLVKLLPFLKSQEDSLRESVEKGYSRYDNRSSGVPSAAVVASAVAEDVAEEADTDAPAAEAKVAAAVAEPVESVPVSDNNAADEAADEESADVDSDTASAKEDDAEAAEAEAAEAAEAEAAETEAAETEAAETEAAETEAADDTVADDTEPADDSPSSDSESADSSDSE